MPASSGIPSEEDYVAAYCRRTGRNSIENWPFYVVLSLFRLGAIAQGVYKRGIDGNASSPAAIERGKKARELAEVGWRIVERSEEHTSELQSLMRISYAVFCLKKKKKKYT